MKKFMLFVVGMFATMSAFAEWSENTRQLPPTSVITATLDGKGNAIITWSPDVKVTRADHYIGHGRKGGVVKQIDVGAAKQYVLVDVVKNGGRTNFMIADPKYYHVECGGNKETTSATLVGFVVDCSYRDPKTGHLVGALEVVNPKTERTFTCELDLEKCKKREEEARARR